ncbi:MAG: PQQ-binding-like beta-propeller repeat protein [Peptococcaceae bacterium]
MSKKQLFIVQVLLLAAVVVLFFSVPVFAAQDSFKFIHLTDTHIGSGPGNKYTPAIIADIAQNFGDVQFLVHGGDITELGLPTEYQAYKEMLKNLDKPFYYVPGNHESRWTDAGKAIFQSNMGKTYDAWDFQGVHFVALDTSIALSQNGHLEKQMLEWLKNDLNKVDKSTPVIIITHHPLFFDEALDASKFMDNDWDIWPIIKDYNVAAIFTGHGHKDLLWEVNDITCLMTEAAMDGGYSIIEVDRANNQLVVYNRLVEGQTLTEYTRIPLTKPAQKRTVNIVSPQTQDTVKDTLVLKAALANWTEPPARVEYKLEDFAWKPLELKGNTYEKEIDLTEVYDGIRSIWVRAVDDTGKIYLDRVSFTVSKDNTVKILWQTDTQGGIQHTPSLSEEYLYIGDNSGRVYQFEQQSGRKMWEFKAQGPVIGSPLYLNGAVYFGSSDGSIYALKATTGKKLWEFKTGGAVVASPIVVGNKLYVGSSDFNMYALEAGSGKLIWKYPLGNTIACSAAYGEDTIFFGSWDQKFYALDAETGTLKWLQEIGSQTYYAPAGSAPLYWQGQVFISTPGGQVYAYSAETGEQLWEVSASSGLSTPIIYQGTLMYNTTSGSIYALDPETGENVWQYDTRLSSYISSPLGQSGNIIYQGLKGRILSVNTIDNSVQWNFNLGETYLFNKGAVHDNVLFVGTLEGKLFALDVPADPRSKPFPKFAAFKDITDHWARRDLNKLAQLGWIKGYDDETYQPETPVTRAQLASILSRFLSFEEPGASDNQQIFSDIKGHWAEKAILAMQEKGIADGYTIEGQDVFLPDNKINRAEAAVMLFRALNLPYPPADFVSKFSDIEDHWAKEAIMALEEKGLISGYSEGDKMFFKPENTLSRAEIGVILVRTRDM